MKIKIEMKEQVKIIFTGDFYGGHRINQLICDSEFGKIFNDFLSNLNGADITVTNLESALIIAGEPIKKTGPAIKANPKTIEALKFAGFNLVTLANNHIMDFGEQGLKETIESCLSNGIDFVGVGKNLQQATQTFYKSIKGIKIAIINVAENEWSSAGSKSAGSHPLNPIANYYKIKEAKENADYVFVVVHGGHETYNLPSPRMKETYRFFADAGASMVIGHHTHCYSGYEVFNGCPIFYSLGNFVFDKNNKGDKGWKQGFALELIVSKTEVGYKIIPYKQDGEIPGVFKLSEDELGDFLLNLKELNKQIQDDEFLENNFIEFTRKVQKSYSAFIEPHSNKYMFALQNRKILPSFLTKSKKRLLLNLTRCEAHRDVLIKILESQL